MKWRTNHHGSVQLIRVDGADSEPCPSHNPGCPPGLQSTGLDQQVPVRQKPFAGLCCHAAVEVQPVVASVERCP